MRITRIEINRTRRRILARLTGVVTGGAVALTFLHFGAARRVRDQDD